MKENHEQPIPCESAKTNSKEIESKRIREDNDTSVKQFGIFELAIKLRIASLVIQFDMIISHWRL